MLTVRDAKTGEIVVSTTIDYDSMSTQDLSDATKRYQRAIGGGIAGYYETVSIQKYYHADHTSGMSLAAVCQQLLAKGFSPDTYRVILWHRMFDCIAFARAIQGRSQLFDSIPRDPLKCMKDSRNQVCLQPYNLACIMKQSSTLLSSACGFMYRTLFPRAYWMRMHTADVDTLARVRMYHLFMEVIVSWLAE